MHYQILMLDVPRKTYRALNRRLGGVDVSYTIALNIQEAAHLCAEKPFQLILLRFPDFTLCSEFFIALRRVTFAPVIALVDQYDEENACDVLQSGADLCVATGWSVEYIVDNILSQFRRYTVYSHYDSPQGRDGAPFMLGDIYIDPVRHVASVRGKSVRLRRREFSLLLYFMKNPKVVLSAEQICDRAWGNRGSYARGVSGPIAILRKAIEPDPAHPVYIKTVNTLGYCFTAHKSETCDICSDSVGLL